MFFLLKDHYHGKMLAHRDYAQRQELGNRWRKKQEEAYRQIKMCSVGKCVGGGLN